LTRDIVVGAKEGIILNVNFREYKIVRTLSFTLKIENSMAYDSTRKLAIPIWGKLKSGFWDVAFDVDIDAAVDRTQYLAIGRFRDMELFAIKFRNDRVYADSYVHIETLRAKSVRYDSIFKTLLLSGGVIASPDYRLFF
jgi:hypothetical protein